MINCHAQRKGYPGHGAEGPRAGRRKPAMRLAARHSPEIQLQRFIRCRSDKTRLSAFRAIVSMGTRAVPMLMDEIARKDSPARGEAAVMLRKIVEGNRHANWDSVIPGEMKGRIKEVLAAAVEDEDERVALNAAAALGAMVSCPQGYMKDTWIGDLAAMLDERKDDPEGSRAILKRMCRLAAD
ncbi:MAG: hypothetical protein PHQ80_01915 [Candidatus ainarchaeum sp.]|nr:hypothetical protein [Candidatus ainarchaeum sp.]